MIPHPPLDNKMFNPKLVCCLPPDMIPLKQILKSGKGQRRPIYQYVPLATSPKSLSGKHSFGLVKINQIQYIL